LSGPAAILSGILEANFGSDFDRRITKSLAKIGGMMQFCQAMFWLRGLP
jgi:hypothetical protein